MSRSRVPISWASRLILNNNHHHHYPISVISSSHFLNPSSQTRHFFAANEDSKPGIFQLRAELEREKMEKLNAMEKGFIQNDKSEATSPDNSLLANKLQNTLGRNHNGVLGLGNARGLPPLAFEKAYVNCLQSFAIHNLADGTKQSEKPNTTDNKTAGKSANFSSYAANQEASIHPRSLRPLSPHLPIYRPHLNSILSILHRISASILSIVVTAFYLLYLKLGLICFSFQEFYQFLFYSSKLNMIVAEISVLAFSYHLFSGFRHLVADFTGTVSRGFRKGLK